MRFYILLNEGDNDDLSEYFYGCVPMDNEEQMMAEFRKIYREFYGEEIEDLDARGLAQNLLNAYRIVHRQPPQNEVDKSI